MYGAQKERWNSPEYYSCQEGGMQVQKDIAEKRLESYPDVAADIINGTIYGGEQVVREGDLEQMETSAYTNDNTGIWHEWRRDLMFLDKSRECCYTFYGIENQSGVDNTMPLRVVGNDFAEYQRQVERFMDENREREDPAYTKRIHDEQKLIPTITTVLFYGEEWTGPRNLLEMLDLKGRENIKPFLMNYELNLVELGKDRELYRKFHSDFRLIVKYLSVRKSREELKQFFNDDKSRIRHVREFLDVMSAISSDSRYRKIKERVSRRTEEEEVSMCLLLDMAEERGEARGEERGERRGLQKGMKEGAHMKALEIAENLLKAGQTIAAVAWLTGLTEVEIEQISTK